MGFSGNIPQSTSIAAEIRALIQGLQLARQLNLIPPQVEIDAREIITMLANDNLLYTNMLIDCRYLLLQLHNPRVQHAYRE